MTSAASQTSKKAARSASGSVGARSKSGAGAGAGASLLGGARTGARAGVAGVAGVGVGAGVGASTSARVDASGDLRTAAGASAGAGAGTGTGTGAASGSGSRAGAGAGSSAPAPATYSIPEYEPIPRREQHIDTFGLHALKLAMCRDFANSATHGVERDGKLRIILLSSARSKLFTALTRQVNAIVAHLRKELGVVIVRVPKKTREGSAGTEDESDADADADAHHAAAAAAAAAAATLAADDADDGEEAELADPPIAESTPGVRRLASASVSAAAPALTSAAPGNNLPLTSNTGPRSNSVVYTLSGHVFAPRRPAGAGTFARAGSTAGATGADPGADTGAGTGIGRGADADADAGAGAGAGAGAVAGINDTSMFFAMKSAFASSCCVFCISLSELSHDAIFMLSTLSALVHFHPHQKCMLLFYRGSVDKLSILTPTEIRSISTAFGFELTPDNTHDAIVFTHEAALGITMTETSLNTTLTNVFQDLPQQSLCFFKGENDAVINTFITNLDAAKADKFSNVYYKVSV
jgi:hypothetical protein